MGILIRSASGGGSSFVEPSNYTLELVYPREAGTSPVASGNVIPTGGNTNYPSSHSANYAYPGLARTIRAMAIGGSIPYEWSLSGSVPSWMSINANTGVITITSDVSAGTYPVTIGVTDAEDTARSSEWTLNVTTSDFYFLDAVNGSDSNAGTAAAPWQTINKLYTSGIGTSARVYFKNGTYDGTGVAGANIDGGESQDLPDERGNDELRSGTLPQTWLAYPGHSPVYNGRYGTLGYDTRGFGVQFTGCYLDGIRFTNVWNMLTHTGAGNYKVYKDCTFDGILGGADSANPSGIMFSSHYGTYDYYTHIAGCVARNMQNITEGIGTPAASPGYPSLTKVYSQRKWLVEFCTMPDGDVGPMDPKAACPRWEIRFNHFYSTVTGAGAMSRGATIYGNYDPQLGYAGHTNLEGEVRFNFFECQDVAIPVIEFGATNVIVYRNTFVGRPWGRWMDAGNGYTHSWYRNFSVNNDSTLPGRISITPSNTHSPTTNTYTAATMPANVTVAADNEDAGPADNAVNLTTGALQGSYLTSFGPTTATPRGCIPSLLPGA